MRNYNVPQNKYPSEVQVSFHLSLSDVSSEVLWTNLGNSFHEAQYLQQPPPLLSLKLTQNHLTESDKKYDW